MSTSESWITVCPEGSRQSLSCVVYSKNYARVTFNKSNIKEELYKLLTGLYKEEDLAKKERGDTSQVRMDLYYLTQVSQTKTKVRFVVGAVEERFTAQVSAVYEAQEKGKWNNVRAFLDSYTGTFILETQRLSVLCDSETVVFVDSEGKPTKKPCFSVKTDDDKKVVIEAGIKGVTFEELKQAFPVKTRKKVV